MWDDVLTGTWIAALVLGVAGGALYRYGWRDGARTRRRTVSEVLASPATRQAVQWEVTVRGVMVPESAQAHDAATLTEDEEVDVLEEWWRTKGGDDEHP